MRILIFDKNKIGLNKIKKILNDFMLKKNIMLDVHMNNNMLDFLNQQSFLENDVVFLGNISSASEVIDYISESNVEIFLIIVSDINEFLIKFLQINTFGYISRKNFSVKTLDKVLGMIYKIYEDSSSGVFKTRENEIIKIKLSDILYMGINNRYIYIKTIDNKEISLINRSFLEINLDLFKHNFIQTYKSMFVNKLHIKKLSSSNNKFELLISNGDILPVSKSRKDKIKNLIFVSWLQWECDIDTIYIFMMKIGHKFKKQATTM